MGRKEDKERWIADTQMFQRIAGVRETSKEALAAEWEKMVSSRRVRNVKRKDDRHNRTP